MSVYEGIKALVALICELQAVTSQQEQDTDAFIALRAAAGWA